MTDHIAHRVLAIANTRAEIDHFIHSVRDPMANLFAPHDFSFHQIRPVPKGRTRIQTWGTPNDAWYDYPDSLNIMRRSYFRYSPGEMLPDKFCVQYEFSTDWTMPWKIYDDLRKKFPKLVILWRAKGGMIDPNWEYLGATSFITTTKHELRFVLQSGPKHIDADELTLSLNELRPRNPVPEPGKDLYCPICLRLYSDVLPVLVSRSSGDSDNYCPKCKRLHDAYRPPDPEFPIEWAGLINSRDEFE